MSYVKKTKTKKKWVPKGSATPAAAQSKPMPTRAAARKTQQPAMKWVPKAAQPQAGPDRQAQPAPQAAKPPAKPAPKAVWRPKAAPQHPQQHPGPQPPQRVWVEKQQSAKPPARLSRRDRPFVAERAKSPTGRASGGRLRPFVAERAKSPTGRSAGRVPAQSDSVRYTLNARRDGEFFLKLYNAWYGADGQRRADGATLDDVYPLMGVGDAGYLTTAVDRGEVDRFVLAGGESYVVTQQTTKRVTQTEKGPVEESHSFDESLGEGDYFYVTNLRPDVVSDADFPKRTRRLVVNLTSQQTGLRVAQALTGLYDADVVGENFYQFKVYLSTTAAPDQRIKNDKVVIYYTLAEDAADGDDVVGDAIVAAVEGAIGADEPGLSMSPFYSRLTPAVSWAEEAEDYMPGTKGLSFTETRAAVIAKVIDDNPSVKDPATLANLVSAAFDDYGVRPDARHRHID